MRVLGIDGCRTGWVGIVLDGGAFAAAYSSASLAEMVAQGDFAAVGVDIPMGLLESGWRDADRAAAALLGARRSSVFAAPPRAVWSEVDYPVANLRCRELTGAGLSRQAFGLRAKVCEADELWTSGAPMHEVHPELSFRTMNGGPLAHSKTTWTGQALRGRLLAEAGIALPEDLGPAGRAGPDDVLDAAAVAWTAHRIALGRAGHVPDPPQRCDHGRPCAIWY